MSVKALTRVSGVCLLIGSTFAFAGECMSYDYAQPTQNAFQSVFYVCRGKRWSLWAWCWVITLFAGFD
jgi:hypothetical protein